MGKIIRLLKPHVLAVVLVLCMLVVQAWCELELPGLMSDIVDVGLTRGGVEDAGADYIAMVAAGMADESVQMAYLWKKGAVMALVALLAAGASVVVGYVASKVGSQIGRDLRRDVFAKVLRFSHKELDDFSTASLITRSTNDIMQVQMACTMLLRMALYAPIMGLGGVFKVVHTRTGMGWIVVAGVIGIAMLMGVLLVVAMPK